MPLFTYRATNDDGKEVRGTIEAPDIESAKHALENLHLEIIDVAEATRLRPMEQGTAPAPPAVAKTAFAFEGTDERGTVRRGTVEAETKHEAFERLKHDQRLYVSSLSPVGVTPVYRDYDLLNWQKGEQPPPPPLPVAPRPPPPPPPPPAAAKPLGFSLPVGTLTPALAAALETNAKPVARPTEQHRYFPLIATLRLYAGWLLAWYALFVALGYYAHVRALPWNIPFVEAFFLSPLIFTFVVAIFLFLLLTSLKRSIGGGVFTGIVLTLLGIAALVFVRMSVW